MLHLSRLSEGECSELWSAAGSCRSHLSLCVSQWVKSITTWTKLLCAEVVEESALYSRSWSMDREGAKCLWFHAGPACVSWLHLWQTCAGYSWSYLCAGAGRCPEGQDCQLSLSSVTVSHSGSLRMVLGFLYGICPKTGALGILGWRHRVALWETTKHSQCWARLISKTRLEHLPYGDSPVASHCVFQCPYYPALLLQWNTSTSHCSDNGKFMMLLQWVIA